MGGHSLLCWLASTVSERNRLIFIENSVFLALPTQEISEMTLEDNKV